MSKGSKTRDGSPPTAFDKTLSRIFKPLNTEVLNSKRLSILAKLVYVSIHRWGRESIALSVESLSQIISVTPGRIKRALRDLEAAGWLEVSWPTRYGDRISYNLTEPPIVDRIAQIPVQSESPG